VFSKHNEAQKANAEKETAEAEAKKSNSVSDLVEKQNATSFENEMKEAV
jgi:hypothetical protein